MPLEATLVIEFTSQLNLQGDPRNPHTQSIGKMNIAAPIDATCYPAKADLYLQDAMLYWFEDLHSSDLAMYKSLIQGAERVSEGWARQRTEATSGITLATSVPPVRSRA